MIVHLTPELEQMVKSKVRDGRYGSVSDVVLEALRLMNDRDLARAEIREKIAAGLESLRQGKGTDGDEFFAEMEAELDAEIVAESKLVERKRA